jgi:hypothetical protein
VEGLGKEFSWEAGYLGIAIRTRMPYLIEACLETCLAALVSQQFPQKIFLQDWRKTFITASTNLTINCAKMLELSTIK